MYIGPVEEGRKALQPLLDFGTPLLDFSGVKPFIVVQQAFDADYPDGLRYYWKALKQQYDPTNLFRLNQNVKPE